MVYKEYRVKEVFDEEACDLESLLKQIFVQYCLQELEKMY